MKCGVLVGAIVPWLPGYKEISVLVHSKTFPIRSLTPQSFAQEAVATGLGSLFSWSSTAQFASYLSPHGYRFPFAPFRAAYSHSISVGNRYCTPSRFERHEAKAFASFRLTSTTGICSLPVSGFPFTQWPGMSLYFVSVTNARYSAFVTSVLSIQNVGTSRLCSGF